MRWIIFALALALVPNGPLMAAEPSSSHGLLDAVSKPLPSPQQKPVAVSDDAALYITKPPVNGAFDVFVIGDSLGSGLWQGLHRNFRDSASPVMNIIDKAKVNTGIVRDDRFDWPAQIEKMAAEGGFQIAVVMFGGNDDQTIRVDGKRFHFQEPGWKEQYERRLDRIITAFSDNGIAVYWVGLPNVKKTSQRENYVFFNSIFKEKAKEHAIQFVDTWNVSNDETGQYQASGLGVDGRKTKLRARDGTHFTPVGYRMLAQYVEILIRDDVVAAQAARFERDIKNTGSDG